MTTQCEHMYECDPGDTHALRCKETATVKAAFVYRDGEETEVRELCASHALHDVTILNLWGPAYGHSARILK